MTPTRTWIGSKEPSNTTPSICGSNPNSTIRDKARLAPHRTSGKRRSKRRGTTQWTPLQDGLKPVPPTRVHPLMTMNRKSFKRKDGVFGARSKDTSAITVLTNPHMPGETWKKKNLRMRPFKPHPQRHQFINWLTPFWPKKRPQPKTLSDSSLMWRMT